VLKKKVRLINVSDIVTARQACRQAARELGFGSADQTRLATAVSELVRNVIQYVGMGYCIITDESNHQEYKIRVMVEDHGLGIADLDKALENGYSTSGGLGAGLPAARRLVHEFEIKSKPGNTTITLIMKRKRF